MQPLQILKQTFIDLMTRIMDVFGAHFTSCLEALTGQSRQAGAQAVAPTKSFDHLMTEYKKISHALSGILSFSVVGFFSACCRAVSCLVLARWPHNCRPSTQPSASSLLSAHKGLKQRFVFTTAGIKHKLLDHILQNEINLALILKACNELPYVTAQLLKTCIVLKLRQSDLRSDLQSIAIVTTLAASSFSKGSPATKYSPSGLLASPNQKACPAGKLGSRQRFTEAMSCKAISLRPVDRPAVEASTLTDSSASLKETASRTNLCCSHLQAC